jgi:Flp pilus assembly protein TadG
MDIPIASTQASMLERLRRRGGEESGVVAVLVAIMLVVFLGMAALAIDLGSLDRAQTQAQSAADAGALAAADSLPSASAASTGTSYATTNDPGATVVVTAPYNSTTNQAKVTVSINAPTFFAQIWGKTSEPVSATAVAQATAASTTCSTAGNGCYAISAMDSNCSNNGVSFSGGGYNIQGGVHSNGSINTGGGGSAYGPTTYGNGSGCTKTTGGGDTFTAGPTQQAPITTWPINYATSYPKCTTTCTGPNGTPSYCTLATASNYTFSYSAPPLAGNIYCAYGTGTPSDPSTYNGTITFGGGGYPNAPIAASYIAGTVSAGNGGIDLQAYNWPTNQLLFYAATGSVTVGGGGNNWDGDFFVPKGSITVAAGSQTTGFLEAQDVAFTSGGITGDGPSDTGTTTTSTGSASLLQ